MRFEPLPRRRGRGDSIEESLQAEARSLEPLLPRLSAAGAWRSEVPRLDAVHVRDYLAAFRKLPELHATLLRAAARGELHAAAIEFGLDEAVAHRHAHRAVQAMLTLLAGTQERAGAETDAR